MTELRPRPPRIQDTTYVIYAADHSRITVRHLAPRKHWVVEDFRLHVPGLRATAHRTFADAWAHVNHLLKEAK